MCVGGNKKGKRFIAAVQECVHYLRLLIGIGNVCVCVCVFGYGIVRERKEQREVNRVGMCVSMQVV